VKGRAFSVPEPVEYGLAIPFDTAALASEGIMRIFVTGASGYIGHAVTEALVRGGHQVTGLVRNTERAALVSARGGAPVIGDLADPSSYRGLARNHEAVVHAAMEGSQRGAELDRIAVETMLGALQEGGTGPRVFVYTSGVWVLGSTREPATEETPVDPPAQVAWRPAHEQLVLRAAGDGLRTVVVRPGVVYGGGRGIIADLMRDAANGLVRDHRRRREPLGGRLRSRPGRALPPPRHAARGLGPVPRERRGG
jgi:nucleoside-diphosphate-sugar epimerase